MGHNPVADRQDSAISTPRAPRPSRARKRAQPVCPADELGPGQKRIVEVRGREVGVFNVEGDYYAVRNFCPHQWAKVCLGTLHGTTLPSEVGEFRYGCEGRILRCPWHGWEYDLADGRCLADPKIRLATVPVSVEDGVVTLWV